MWTSSSHIHPRLHTLAAPAAIIFTFSSLTLHAMMLVISLSAESSHMIGCMQSTFIATDLSSRASSLQTFAPHHWCADIMLRMLTASTLPKQPSLLRKASSCSMHWTASSSLPRILMQILNSPFLTCTLAGIQCWHDKVHAGEHSEPVLFCAQAAKLPNDD